jgi:hypothetical protein
LVVVVVLGLPEEPEDLPPQPAAATVTEMAALTVSMAISGVLFMGRARGLARGLGRPPYQRFDRPAAVFV